MVKNPQKDYAVKSFEEGCFHRETAGRKEASEEGLNDD